MIVDVQFNQATIGWPQLRDRAQAAESAGFGAVWVFDHLAGLALRGEHMLEAFTLLGALAASTSTIELGTMVVNVHHRTPAVVAVAATTVEAIADRQFHLGLGAGSAPGSRWAAEMRAVGQPIEPTATARHAAVARTLDTVDRLWSPDRDPALDTFPLPRRRPTVLIGVSSVALAELAGRRSDGLNVAWDHPRRDELVAAALAAQQRPDRLVLTTWAQWDEDLLDEDHPSRRTMSELQIDRLVLVVPGSVDAARIAAATR